MEKIPVIIDCDPGHDDAIALTMALASEKLEVLGVTLVGGNQTLEKITKNCLTVLDYIGKEVPVAVGAEGPIRRELTVAANVHGESGLDGPTLPPPHSKPVSTHAVEFMRRLIEGCDRPVTLIPLGPLTNIATLFLAHPELKAKISRISLMGGAAISGNRTPTTEFNTWQDPEATHLVFSSGIPITMCGIDITHKALIRDSDITDFRAIGNRAAVMVADLLDFFSSYYKSIGVNETPLHDPVAVAWVIDPTICRTEHLNVSVDLDGEHTVGCTVTDFRGVTGKEPNCDVGLDIDREAFVDLIKELLHHYDEQAA